MRVPAWEYFGSVPAWACLSHAVQELKIEDEMWEHDLVTRYLLGSSWVCLSDARQERKIEDEMWEFDLVPPCLVERYSRSTKMEIV